MSNKTNVNKIPKIQQAPRMASDTAIHYGYVAFKDIHLGGAIGLEHHVQPQESPYYRELPCRELIPFTNIVYMEIDEEAAAAVSYLRGGSPIIPNQKTARECAYEMLQSYETWGFEVLSDLTGYDEDEAFHVFQTIQPFTYRLKDLLQELEYNAVERIENTEAYTVEYEGESYQLNPLPKELKEVALRVLPKMIRSADVAVTLGEDTKEKTTQAMTQYFATGTGKRRPDPLDHYVFQELGEELPKLVDNKNKNNDGGILGQLVELLGGKKNDSIEKELAELRELKEKLASSLPSPKTVTIGQTVSVNGQEAVVTSKPFGKIKVTFTDGSTQTVEKTEIE